MSQDLKNHTPGPWSQSAFGLATIIAVHSGTDDRGQIGVDGRHQHFIAQAEGDNWRANASLIAAAPELLDALTNAVSALCSLRKNYRSDLGIWDDVSRFIEAGNAAIAKARADG